MRETWLPHGTSDPLSYHCTCPTPESGLVLLFYRYFCSPPSIPRQYQPLASSPTDLATFHSTVTSTLNLRGKIRIAREGFNVTVGGTAHDVRRYMELCVGHWSFAGLDDLDSEEGRRAYFKPTKGCGCVFGPSSSVLSRDGEKMKEEGGANVRICDEITPMGVSNYAPTNWDVVESLEPADFHERLCRAPPGETVLVDVRNHYESRIGYFVDPETGQGGVRPAIRRFGQWPQFVLRHLSSDSSPVDPPSGSDIEAGGIEERVPGKGGGKQYLTYCTGGIRCEKGARFLAEKLGTDDSVCTLKGGIQAYLTWMDEEIAAERRTPAESLFKGRNYVFDARGSTGLDANGIQREMVATCHSCKFPEDRLSKCRSRGCHLVLVVCQECERGDVRCCADCLQLDKQAEENSGARLRKICECERERELQLWGVKEMAKPKKSKENTKARRTRPAKAIKFDDHGGINIQIKTIE